MAFSATRCSHVRNFARCGSCGRFSIALEMEIITCWTRSSASAVCKPRRIARRSITGPIDFDELCPGVLICRITNAKQQTCTSFRIHKQACRIWEWWRLPADAMRVSVCHWSCPQTHHFVGQSASCQSRIHRIHIKTDDDRIGPGCWISRLQTSLSSSGFGRSVPGNKCQSGELTGCSAW